jgi:PIN domain nuclease of toxin-antitoxin system
MILLDTHTWIWWVNGSKELSTAQRDLIENNINDGLGLSSISIWEAAKLVEKKRLLLTISINDWIEKATDYPGIEVLPLSNAIIIKSTQLEGSFRNDPADQLIVATSIIQKIPLLTADEKILNYPFVDLCK